MEGMDVLMQIEASRTDPSDRPIEKIVIAECGLYTDATPAFEMIPPPADNVKQASNEEL